MKDNLSGNSLTRPELPENIDSTWGLYVAGFSIAFFTLVNLVLTKHSPSEKVTPDVWRWKNTFISWIHAVIIGLCDLYCLVFASWMFSDLVGQFNYVMYLLIAFSEGYFIYDALDIILSRKAKSNWEVLVHHVVVISSFWYNLQWKIAIPFTILALMTEINSIFLHARKLLQLCKVPFQHWLYRSVVIMNFVTFIAFRFPAVIWVGYGLWNYKDSFPSLYHTALSISMIPIWLINPILFWRLFKSDILRNFKVKVREENGFISQNGRKSNSDMKKTI